MPEPCAEDWNTMIPKGCGRFCAACEKTVVDFTAFSDEQFISYFQQNGLSTCGRFTPHQFTLDIPWLAFNEKQRKRSSNISKYGSYAALTLFAFSALSNKTFATPPIHHVPYFSAPSEESNQKTIKGIVTDGQKNPLAGAKVELKDSHVFAITDTSGNFSLVVTTENCTLKITRSGFQTIEKELHSFKDLVVIELQIGIMVAGGIEKRPMVNILDGLDGPIPGIAQVSASPGIPGAQMEIRVGGVSSVVTEKLLIVVDGKRYDGNLSDLDPGKIETVTKIKPANAQAIYGADGANRVIVITLKKDKQTFWERVTKPFRRK